MQVYVMSFGQLPLRVCRLESSHRNLAYRDLMALRCPGSWFLAHGCARLRYLSSKGSGYATMAGLSSSSETPLRCRFERRQLRWVGVPPVRSVGMWLATRSVPVGTRFILTPPRNVERWLAPACTYRRQAVSHEAS